LAAPIARRAARGGNGSKAAETEVPGMEKGNPIYAVGALASALLMASLLFVARVAVGARLAALPPIPKPGALAQPRSETQPGFPADQTRAAIPADNPPTPDKVSLGEKLFFDGRLSADGTVACATCHDPGAPLQQGSGPE